MCVPQGARVGGLLGSSYIYIYLSIEVVGRAHKIIRRTWSPSRVASRLTVRLSTTFRGRQRCANFNSVEVRLTVDVSLGPRASISVVVVVVGRPLYTMRPPGGRGAVAL